MSLHPVATAAAIPTERACALSLATLSRGHPATQIATAANRRLFLEQLLHFPPLQHLQVSLLLSASVTSAKASTVTLALARGYTSKSGEICATPSPPLLPRSLRGSTGLPFENEFTSQTRLSDLHVSRPCSTSQYSIDNGAPPYE